MRVGTGSQALAVTVDLVLSRMKISIDMAVPLGSHTFYTVVPKEFKIP